MAAQELERIGSIISADRKAALIEDIRSAGTEAQTAETKLFRLRDELVELGGAVTQFPSTELFEKVRGLFGEFLFPGGVPTIEPPEVDSSAAAEAMEEFVKLEGKALTGVAAINNFFNQEVANIQAVGAEAGAAQDRINALVATKNQERSAAISKFYEEEYAAAIKHFEMLRKAEQQRQEGKDEAEQLAKDKAKEIRDATLADFEASIEREEELIQSQKDMREGNLEHMLDVMAREEKAAQDMATARVRMNQQVLTSAQSLTQGMLSNMNKESGAYKAIFALSQALAIAQTVINTEMAAAAALAPPPVGLGPLKGPAYAGIIRAIGYSSVAMIAAQTLASFEGGGFTGKGARSGGVDGKGGFPAILHPNETVIDHEQGGQSPVVVHQTINVTTGVQQTVRAEIANLLPQISEAAKSAVQDSRLRGGTFS